MTLRKKPKDEPFRKFLGGIFKDCGLEPVYTATGGGSDANVFNHRGVMAINISTGMQKVHSAEEFILIRDLFNGCLVVLSVITSLESVP